MNAPIKGFIDITNSRKANMNRTTTSVAALAATALAGTVWAHSGATGKVKDRMEAMKEMGKAMKSVAPMMRGEADYDPDTVRQAAQAIARNAGDALTAHFPEGSIHGPSEALPAIWQDWDRFEALAMQLEVTAQGLEGAADNGLGGMGTGSGGMGAMMGQTGGGMMTGNTGMMMGNSGGPVVGMSAEHIAQMPADGAFAMTAQVCSACHSDFRAEDD